MPLKLSYFLFSMFSKTDTPFWETCFHFIGHISSYVCGSVPASFIRLKNSGMMK